jgi:uncharacterized paraquat-inducible protein A
MGTCKQARGAACIGCGECRREDRRPTCPKCGAELNFDDTIYLRDSIVIGCVECISESTAEEEWPDE